jgi:hypothetical protein
VKKQLTPIAIDREEWWQRKRDQRPGRHFRRQIRRLDQSSTGCRESNFYYAYG